MLQGSKMDSTRVVIQIKRVWLAVRFNCKLSFIIRNQLSEKIAETDNTFNLFRGECLVNQTLYFQLPLEVLAARAKKLKLIVMMISANGMVPAGFVTFSTHPKSPYEQFQAIMPLERCEDSRAQIKFMHMYENCTRTTIEHSYINHLINKQDHQLYENIGALAKAYQKNSHSVNREDLSARKYRTRESENYGQLNRASFNKPLISPRTISRNSEMGTVEKSVKINSFKKEAGGRIAQEMEPNDSSINPLTREQLMKEHQEYWLEIIRLEEEMENLKEENKKINEENKCIKEENAMMKAQGVALKDYYEGHEEKIHAFLGEIEQNGEIIKRLQAEIKQYKVIIAQKEELEKEFQSLMETQSKELRQSLNKYADLSQRLHSAQEQKKTNVMKFEMLNETINFLQNQAKKYSDENLQLKTKIASDEDRLYFLQNNNETQKNIIIKLQTQIDKLNQESEIISALQADNSQLKKQKQALKESKSQNEQQIQRLQKQIQEHAESKEMLMLQSSLKEEEAIFTQSKHAQATQELEQIKKAYDALSHSSSIDQSKIKIFQKQLELASKEKDDYVFELRKRQEQMKELKRQLQQFADQDRAIRIKLIQCEASLSGKSATIDQLKVNLAQEEKEKLDLLDKSLSLEKEFEEMELLLSKEVEEKNKMTFLLTNLEDNFRSIDDERSYLNKAKEQLVKYNAKLKQQIQDLKTSLKKEQERNKQKQQQLQRQLDVSQEQLNDVIEKAAACQMQLQSTLSQLQEQKEARNTVRDQYQQSYNVSLTALTLKHGKLQKQLEQVNKQLLKQKNEYKIINQKLAAKQAQVNEVKSFTHSKLQQNLKLMKQNNDLKSKDAEATQNFNNLRAIILNKDFQLSQLNMTNESLKQKIDQLDSELQFVTEILQRERQDKSDIEKQFDHLEKSQLPQIVEVGQFKEESIEEHRQDDVQLQIQSKVINSSSEQIPGKPGQKTENGKKKKKKQ